MRENQNRQSFSRGYPVLERCPKALVAAIAWLFACLVLAGPAGADSVPKVNIPASFSVSATGAFSYSVPLAVPPGRAGMLPALSLDYSSQNGDGLEGIGFVL